MDPLVNVLGAWAGELNGWSVLLRVCLSVALAAVIGCERSSKRHAAGLRTFILISLAGTGAMLLELFLLKITGKGYFLISAAVVVGVAVVSINSVLYSSRNQIKGLTTSAGLWAVGILGLAVGAGYYTVTAVMFLALLISLSLFPNIERYLKNRSNHFEVHIELINPAYLKNFVTTIRRLGLTIDELEANPAYAGSGLSVYSVAVSITSAELKKFKTHKEIIEALQTLEYIDHIEEID